VTFLYEERASASPYVDAVWRTRDVTDGTYLASADACWDLIVVRSGEGCRVRLSGPSSRPTVVPYRAGNRNVGVRFLPGTYFTHIPASQMCDRTVDLPMVGERFFALAGELWAVPGYDDVDDLIQAFADTGLLAHDDVVARALAGEPALLSDRSVQRHFSRATGLSLRHVRQIARARRAAALLREGRAIADVAYELGYADQAHLTRDLHRLVGFTPGQSRRRDEPV
jgi:AraC-like DNA-binding protein